MISSFYSTENIGQFGIWVVELWRVCWLCFFTVPRPSLVLVWAPDHIVLLKFLWTSIGSWALEYRVDGIYLFFQFTGSVEWDSNNSNLPIYMEFLDEIWIYPIKTGHVHDFWVGSCRDSHLWQLSWHLGRSRAWFRLKSRAFPSHVIKNLGRPRNDLVSLGYMQW